MATQTNLPTQNDKQRVEGNQSICEIIGSYLSMQKMVARREREKGKGRLRCIALRLS